MVCHYKKKTETTYNLETLKKAVEEVKNGVLNSYQASRKYNIPRTAIVDRVKLRRGVVKDTKGRPTAIPEKYEKKLLLVSTLWKKMVSVFPLKRLKN